MSDRVEITIDNGVADIRMVRADKMNALDGPMFEALRDAGAQVSKDPRVRCVVLSGEGRAFCAGLDMGNFGNMAKAGDSDAPKRENRLSPRTRGIANDPQYAAWVWRECPVPVIAAVHGAALGGGFQVQLGADIRITHPETKLSVLEIKWGLVPDMGGTALMRELARGDIIRELTYTGRIFSGAEALEYGFATRVSETPYEDALALAREIANKNPDAIRGNKRIFNSVGQMSEADALQQESNIQDAIIGSPNQIEAVKSSLQKRAPDFVDP